MKHLLKKFLIKITSAIKTIEILLQSSSSPKRRFIYGNSFNKRIFLAMSRKQFFMKINFHSKLHFIQTSFEDIKANKLKSTLYIN